MNHIEFIHQMDRIKDTFGPTHYSKERMDMIWKFTNTLHIVEFIDIVDSCIANFKFAPLPNDFLKAFYEKRKSQYRENQKQTFSYDIDPTGSTSCTSCYETGYCFVEIKGYKGNGPIVMECYCSNGIRKVSLPKWSQKNSENISIKKFPFDLFIPNKILKNQNGEIIFNEYRISGSNAVENWFKNILKNSEELWNK